MHARSSAPCVSTVHVHPLGTQSRNPRVTGILPLEVGARLPIANSLEASLLIVTNQGPVACHRLLSAFGLALAA